MDTPQQILSQLIDTEDVAQFLEVLPKFAKELSSIPPRDKCTPNQFIMQSLMRVAILCTNKQNQEVIKIINEEMLYLIEAQERTYDKLQSRLIYYYYKALKHTGGDDSITQYTNLFTAFISHREMGNKESTAMLVGIILDLLTNNHFYEQAEMFISEVDINMLSTIHLARFYFYKGVIAIVKGEPQSLEYFQHSLILHFSKKAEKYSILSMIMNSQFELLSRYKWKEYLQPYHELVRAVKSGVLDKYTKICKKYEEVYKQDGVFVLIQRLTKNVLEEGIRRICLIYSRITIQDMAVILKMKIEEVKFLLLKNIKNGSINGIIQNGIYIGLPNKKKKIYLGLGIRESINLIDTMNGMMKYPEQKKICFENMNIMENGYSEYGL
ncbi:26S proteasome regulatory subunit RPN3 [Astathelohania contejeani]|uniref:26S proteasome regulatory subunit RPN3 n=1 Tax=Astathelohania contejeani TaxID=164912 RepID=A0ABQ7I2P3_9MICR|nr:26S proteasome regulatory subunit RPN3 [Thelohania contejeani]